MHIPGYTIVRELGSGGMATVYLAQQDRLGREVALKVMQPQAMAGNDFASRFLKEGRIIAHLQHPQVVTIYDLDIAEGLHYFSMEYLPGGTLSDQIVRGLSAQQAIDITRRIAQALAVAHDHGVIHRDIKPQNILFRADGTPVLTDFGIARATRSGPEATQLTSAGVVVGSPRYMSPEQSMSRQIDVRSDLYSLGVVFYEMLTKELPYESDDVISLAMKHYAEPIPALSGPLGVYQPILEKLLAKEPEDRFEDTQELIAALDAFQTGQTTLVRTPEGEPRIEPDRTSPTPKPFKPKPSRNRTKIAIVVLTLAVPIVAAGLYFLATQSTKDPLDEFAAALSLPPPDADRPDITARYEKVALEHLRDDQLPRSLELVKLALESNRGDKRLNALQAIVVDRIEANRLLREAEGRFAEDSFDESLALIARGLEQVPGHEALTALRRKVLQEREEHNAAQALALLEAAQAAFDSGDYEKGIQIASDGLDLVPENAQLKALEARLQERLDQERAIHEIAAQVSTLIELGRPTDGLREVEKGLALAADDPELLALKENATERIKREAADMRQRAAQGGLEEASFGDNLALIDEALALIENALAVVPRHQGLIAQRDELVQERAKQNAARVERLLEQAQAAFEQDDLSKSLQLCEEGLSLDHRNARLIALKAEVNERIAQKKGLNEIIAQASSLIDQQQPNEALSLIEEALDSAPESTALLDLKKMASERVQRQAAEQAAELSAQAQALAQQGKFEDALERVKSAQTLRPGDPALSDLAAKIKAQRSESYADALAVQAADALAAGRLTEALDLTEKGLREWPEHVKLLALQSDIRSRIAEERTIAETVENARALLRDERVADGRKVLDDALNRYPGNALLLGLHKEFESARKQKEEDQVRQLVQQASRLFDLRDLDAAMERVNKGLELRPQHPELLSMRKRIEDGRVKLEEVAHLLPEMIAVKGGCFRIGSPETEPNRESDERAHRICIEDFELAKFETRMEDFRRFVDAVDFKTDAERGVGGVAGCWAFDRDAGAEPWGYQAWANWRVPNKYHETGPKEPVTCISNNDARAYIRWLNKATGQRFRLPTEAEWEYGARAGTTTARFWGDGTDQAACRNANVADTGHGWGDGFPCDDGYEWAAPTGSFAPNPWGFHDMLGNASEWTCSRYDSSYGGSETRCAQTNSTAPVALRGGAWNSGPAFTRAAYRDRNYPTSRYGFVGFRVARDSTAKAQATIR